MKALVVNEPGDYLVREWPVPRDDDGDVLVASLVAGICGTDLELVDGTIDPHYVRYPLVLGHEWVGRLEHAVAGIGPVGTKVVVEGVIACQECEACRRGASNLCVRYDEIGFTRDGAIAEHVGVPKHLLHRLMDDVDLNDAVLVEPMAVVWRALTRIPLREGLRVAIIGDGTIALLGAHLVRRFAPASVTVIGRREAQRSLAQLAGADLFVVTESSQDFDLVLEASGSIDGVASAIERCARGGMVILLGLPPHGATLALAPDDLVNNDVIVQGSFSYTREAFAAVVSQVNTGDLRPSFLVTHRFDLDDAASAIAALRGGASVEARGKVVVDVAPR